MASTNPPPPPPPPPPPLPQEAAPPPPPLPDEFRRAAAAAAAELEAARCRETELQAWTAWGASLLRHGGGSSAGSGSSAGFTVPVAAAFSADDSSSSTTTAIMPGSCVDAWRAVARAAAPKEEEEGEAAAAAAVAAADLLSQQQQQQRQQAEDAAIEIPPGQQSAAVQTLCAAHSLRRTAELAETVLRERGEGAARWQQVWQPQLTNNGSSSNNNSSNNSTSQSWWLQALDERLQEIRQYHAAHSSATAATALASTTTGANAAAIAAAGKRHRHGNPAADGYDLAAAVEQWTHRLDATLFSVDEVRGKYLDLRAHYEQLVRIGNSNNINSSSSSNNHASFVSQLRCSSSGSDDGDDRDHHDGSKSTHATTTKKQQQKQQKQQKQQQYQYVDFLEDLARGGPGRAWPGEAAKLRHRRKYLRWLRSLRQYLEQFLEKTVPLLPVRQQVIAVAERAFAREWSQTGGAAPGWRAVPAEAALAGGIVPAGAGENDSGGDKNGTEKEKQTTTTTTTTTTAKIDLAKFASAEELAAQADGDLLKAELSLLGLKCGGTVLDRARRLFLLKDRKLEDLPPKVFAKNSKMKQQQQQQQQQPTAATNDQDATMSGSTTTTPTTATTATAAASTEALLDRRIDLARAECVVTALLDQVRPKLEATVRRTERRQTQTLKEREREMADELFGAGVVVVKKKQKTNSGDDNNNDSDTESDEDDAPIYNPKNVPLDWDGKPIPYWLFKLHGLNHYYDCEICGGESYRGRRHFELHFAEQRHGAGMRALGIPNTKHFHGVTRIDDARDLWRSLQDKLAQEQFDGTREEEYEDSSGNVLSRKTYEDLARQGLL